MQRREGRGVCHTGHCCSYDCGWGRWGGGKACSKLEKKKKMEKKRLIPEQMYILTGMLKNSSGLFKGLGFLSYK